MSVVTDIILVTGIDDGAETNDSHPNVDALNAWLDDNQINASNALRKVDQHAGGGKAMQCDVFVCAINYLLTDDFLAAFRAIKWERPERVQLMLKGENDDTFTVYGVRE